MDIGAYEKFINQAHYSTKTIYGQSINMQFGVGNGESFEQSFFSSLFLYAVHHFYLYNKEHQAIPQ